MQEGASAPISVSPKQELWFSVQGTTVTVAQFISHFKGLLGWEAIIPPEIEAARLLEFRGHSPVAALETMPFALQGHRNLRLRADTKSKTLIVSLK